MTEPAQNRLELAVRLHRNSMALALVQMLGVGAIVVAGFFWPDSTSLARVEGLLWVPIAIGMAIQYGILRRHRLRLDDPEAKAIERDEWRRACMARATRGALIVVLAAQVPSAFLFVHLPTVRAVWGMAILTVTLGVAVQLALFLYFDRE